jgi:hypothetical protein
LAATIMPDHAYFRNVPTVAFNRFPTFACLNNTHLELKPFIPVFMMIYLLMASTSLAQPAGPLSKKNFSVEAKFEYGFLLSHHLELDVFKAHFPAIEISLQKETWGSKRWEEEYAYPSLGVSIWMSNLGGFKEIGNAFALYPFINFPLMRHRENSVHFKIGIGAAYLTNHFDRIENYKNFAIGSAFNLAASLYFDYKLQISKRLSFSVGFGLTHFSNGSTKTPNYGLNVFTATTGITYYLNKPHPYMKKKLLPRHYPFEFDGSKFLEMQVSTAVASKDMTEQLGERFMVYAVFTNIMARVGYKSKFGLGVDYTYDESDSYLIKRDKGFEPNLRDATKVGINFAYELVLDRTSFLFNAGMYVAGKERSEGDFFQRLTLKYHITDLWFANMALSAHLGKAEYIGLGIGHRIPIKYRQRIPHD